MALTIEKWKWATRLRENFSLMEYKNPWEVGALGTTFVESRREGDFLIDVYRCVNDYYEFIHEFKLGTWTTPSGEIRPCVQKTKVLVDVVKRPTPA